MWSTHMYPPPQMMYPPPLIVINNPIHCTAVLSGSTLGDCTLVVTRYFGGELIFPFFPFSLFSFFWGGWRWVIAHWLSRAILAVSPWTDFSFFLFSCFLVWGEMTPSIHVFPFLFSFFAEGETLNWFFLLARRKETYKRPISVKRDL